LPFYLLLFLWTRVTELRLALILWNKVTEFRLVLSWNMVSEFRLTLIPRFRLSEVHLVMGEIGDRSEVALERASRDQAKQYIALRPRDFQEDVTRTEQGIGLLTIPVLATSGQFGPAKFAKSSVIDLPGQSH